MFHNLNLKSRNSFTSKLSINMTYKNYMCVSILLIVGEIGAVAVSSSFSLPISFIPPFFGHLINLWKGGREMFSLLCHIYSISSSKHPKISILGVKCLPHGNDCLV